MFEIDNKLFGYISKSNDLTEDIIQRYKNSLIFIGDEKQIYVPTTNSYVGVGTSTLEDIRTSISSSDKIYISDYANNNLTDPNTTYYFPVINNTVPHTYYHTYVALNVGVNPVAGKFIGGLQGTADYATVSDLTYKITTKVSSENQSYYVPFVNQMDAESYAYTNNRLLYNPHQELLISTYFSGTLRGKSTYAEYAYIATDSTYSSYSLFNSYQSIYQINNNKNYHITFSTNDSYSLSYIDNTFYYNPALDCVYAGHFYGTFHGDTDLFESIRGGDIIINGNALIQENTYVKIGTKELGSGYSYQYIISYLDGDLVSTYENNLRMYVNINGIPINKEITYLHATYLGNVAKEDLFTQFSTESNQITRITIGGTTKDLQIESYKTLVSQKTDNTAYPLVFTNATNSSGSGDLYKNYSNLLYNPYKQSLSSGLDTEATGNHSFATGSGTKANGENSVAEGYNSIAGGGHSHAEGSGTKTLKGSAHAEGILTIADGVAAHAEGSNTIASGENSHASGLYTLASHINESAFGKYNASNNDTLFSVGIGTASNNRINAFEVTTNGKVKAYDGFYKNNSDNTYLLLGGGGHKLLSDLFTQFSTETNQVTRITVGGVTKDLQINADTLDGTHASELFTYLGNDNKQLSVTIGGTNKKLTINYATESNYTDHLKGPDNRNTDSDPLWYMTNKGVASLYGEFCMYNGATSNMYEYRMTMTPWGDNSGGRPVQMAFNNNGAFLRTSSTDTTWNAWEHILTSGNSSVSGNGGSSWGDSITVTINNVTKTLTIPSNPNTDYLVRQLLSSSNNNYNLLFKWTNDNNDETSQARYASTLYYNPSTKLLTNNGSLLIDAFNVGNETGIFFRSGFVSSGIYNCSILAYDHNNNGNDPDGLSINAYDGVSFCTGSNTRQERMRITSGGNIGIGTNSPSYKLHVIGSSTDFSTPISSFQNDSDTSWLANAGFISPNITAGHYTAIEIGKSMDQGNVGHLSFYYAGNDSPDNRFALGFYNYIDLLVVKRNGNVGIGTTSPSYKLHVDGNVYASGFRHSSVNSNDYVLTAGGSYKQWTTNNTASAIVARDSNGNISGARYYSEISDENIDIGSVYIKNTTDDAIRRISLSNFISKITSLVDTEDTVEFKDKSLKVTETWMDTGITTAAANFPKGNGTYAVQISHGTLNNGSDSWPAIYSGIITIYNGTNGSYTDEVILHRSGHEGGKRLYLRTIQTTSSTGYCKIQIAASANFGANASLTFKFRKLI